MTEAQTQLLDFVQSPAPVARPSPAPTELRLLRLTLRDFKGLHEFTLDAAGGNVDIFGDNATGKTTLFDAYNWLLFNKDSANRADFAIKTLGADGEPAHGLEHSVEGVFRLGSREVTLRKVYAEQWTKQRGSPTKVFTGHATEHYIDGVPVRKGDYEAYIASIVDEGAFRLLSDPAYFNEQLKWQDRRQLLLEVCGDIDDAAVIASDPSLAALTEILGGRKLADHKKVLAAAKTKLNAELAQIPVRISEVNRGLPEVQDLGSKAGACLVAARATRQKKGEELALSESGGQAGQWRKRLAEIETGILDIENRERRKDDEALAVRRRALQDAQAAVLSAERVLGNSLVSLGDLEDRVRRFEDSLEALRDQFRAASATTLTYTDETACPTCGQALPEEMVEEARGKALERFNADRARHLERLDTEGKELRLRRDQADAAATRLKEEAAKAEAGLADLREKADDAAEAVTLLETARFDLGRGPDYARLTAERDNLTAALAMAPQAPDTTALRAEIDALEEAVATCERTISQAEQRTRGLARIEELGLEEKRLAAEYERLERELYLTEEFTRAKVRLLTDRINKRFTYARFRLFNVLVNGAVEECCETTVGGVPYGSGLNHGAQMNAGIEILNVLSEHYGFVAPVFVDNAEAIVNILPSRGQMIKLIVSGADKQLRVEVDQ
jgi:hypothetical protein